MNDIDRRDGEFQRSVVAVLANIAGELKRLNDREDIINTPVRFLTNGVSDQDIEAFKGVGMAKVQCYEEREGL